MTTDAPRRRGFLLGLLGLPAAAAVARVAPAVAPLPPTDPEALRRLSQPRLAVRADAAGRVDVAYAEICASDLGCGSITAEKIYSAGPIAVIVADGAAPQPT